MTPRALARLLLAYVGLACLLCATVHHAASLREVDGEHVVSAWRKGELVARATNGRIVSLPGVSDRRRARRRRGALLTSIEPVFALSLVPGLDGVKATFNGLTAYVTPDDLLSRARRTTRGSRSRASALARRGRPGHPRAPGAAAQHDGPGAPRARRLPAHSDEAGLRPLETAVRGHEAGRDHARALARRNRRRRASSSRAASDPTDAFAT